MTSDSDLANRFDPPADLGADPAVTLVGEHTTTAEHAMETPGFTAETTLVGPDNAINANISLACRNIPAGSEVRFECLAPNNGGPGYVSPIELPWTTVPPPSGGKDGDIVPDFQAGVTTELIAHYDSKVVYAYRSNGHPTPEGFMVSLQFYVVTNGGD